MSAKLNLEPIDSQAEIDNTVLDQPKNSITTKKSSIPTFSAPRGSNKTNLSSVTGEISKPVFYNGKEITTAKDLLDNIKLDNFYESL